MLRNRQAIVIGPTPPGTGVSASATARAAAKSTSPSRRDAPSSPMVRLIPTSTTVAPGLLRTGSHKNAFFKGQHRKEFAWFSLGASSPVVSMDADRAACQILDAVRNRRPELTITFAARLAALAQALLPNVTADLMKLTARLLPRMSVDSKNKTYTGWESGSSFSPSLLTRIADRATELYNGLRDHSSSR